MPGELVHALAEVRTAAKPGSALMRPMPARRGAWKMFLLVPAHAANPLPAELLEYEPQHGVQLPVRAVATAR